MTKQISLMKTSKMATFIGDASLEELDFLQIVVKDLDSDERMDFMMRYRSRRRKKDTILIMSLLGLAGIAGIQRFYLRQPILGVLYFITAGFFFIGTIIDTINHRNLTEAYNEQVAVELRDEYEN